MPKHVKTGKNRHFTCKMSDFAIFASLAHVARCAKTMFLAKKAFLTLQTPKKGPKRALLGVFGGKHPKKALFRALFGVL